MVMAAGDVAHLLRRAGFGGTGVQVAALAGQAEAAVVDAVLDTAANPPEARPAALDQMTDEDRWARLQSIRFNWHDRMATTPTPIVEKMTLFWHGHFTTSADAVYRPNALWQQLTFYRANALGNLRTLAHGMAVQPAMLMYLNNDENRKKSPNQNFARELLELFLLGVGNYTEGDVIAAAAAWTGHTLTTDDYDTDVAVYGFRADWHDTADKTFLGITKNWDGPGIIDELFDNPTTRPVLAKFIVGKLWAFFAAPNPPAGVVDALAATLIASNFEIRPVLRALFLRTEFYAPEVKAGLVRTPVEYVTAVMRATGLAAADIHPEWWLDDMGQELYSPPNVSGWRPNGYWISAASAAAKASFADWLTWRLKDAGFLADSKTKTPADAVAAALAAFAIHQPSARIVQVLTDWVNTQRAAKVSWAEQKYLPLLVLLSPDLQLA